MAKLFNTSEEAVALEQDVCIHDQLPEAITEHSQSINMALEASQMAIEHMQTVQGMHDSLTAKKLCSTAYLHTLEAYSPLVRSMGARMGVKSLPSLESFSNRHAAQDAHNYAVEGFKEMLSKIWERIKDFFRELFKKVKLFIRRLTGANLELDNYEKYCDQLVGKLKTNNAVISDKSALISDLPRLLCDANGAPVDSDFVLNQGGAKINNLINQMKTINYGAESTKLHTDVKDFKKALEEYISDVSKPVTQGVFNDKTKDITEQGTKLMTSVFPHRFLSTTGLSPKVSEEISNRFAGRVTDSDLTYMSMVEDHGTGNQMPTGINIYLVTSTKEVAGEPVLPCVFIGTQYTASVGNTLPPIASLNNLVRFHSDYKATLAKFNAHSGNKSVDALSSELDKLLSLLQQKFPALMQVTEAAAAPESLAPTVENLITVVKKIKNIPGCDLSTAVAGFMGLTGNAEIKMDAGPGLTLVHNLLQAFIANDDPAVLTATNELKAGIAMALVQMNIAVGFLGNYLKNNSGPVNLTQDELVERVNKVKALQRLLTHVFAQLQTLYRGMMVEFYKVYTELRYAVIKYIYDSAKRYTY